MSRQPTEDLIHELVQDLPSVRPIARLRVAGVSVLVAWAVVAGLAGWFADEELNPWWTDPVSFGVLLGLVVTAIGATLAALAGAVPGREANAAAGWVAAGAGLVLLTGSAVWGWVGGSTLSQRFILADSLECFIFAVVFAAAPLWVAGRFLMRAATATPLTTSAAAATGTAGLGAVAVHAMCLDVGGAHVLLGHFLFPLLTAALLAIPLAAAVRHR